MRKISFGFLRPGATHKAHAPKKRGGPFLVCRGNLSPETRRQNSAQTSFGAIFPNNNGTLLKKKLQVVDCRDVCFLAIAAQSK
jgi:hypothetical protein